ncbi:MAG: hypothetical protein JOZ62_20500 [Acidobacteriaceae bacterium]|nr:hypothetical protein [Acidobacteriaceae bacterium]
MRSIRLAFALAVAGLSAPANYQNIEVKIIANPAIQASEISRDELSRIFLITKSSMKGTQHVEPVLEKGGPTENAFLKQYIGRTDGALMTYYRSLMFTGKASIPKSFNSDPEVAEYVARTKGAIGYVSAGANPAGVKVLTVR